MKKTDQQIFGNQLKDLRANGLLSESEIAFISGDLLVAENVVTGQKRIIGESTILSESKRLLKG